VELTMLCGDRPLRKKSFGRHLMLIGVASLLVQGAAPGRSSTFTSAESPAEPRHNSSPAPASDSKAEIHLIGIYQGNQQPGR
jgi:hypothetical protein